VRGAAAGAEGIERGEGGAARKERGGVEEGYLGVELREGRGGEALVVAGQAQPAHARQRLCIMQEREGERGGCSDKVCVYTREPSVMLRHPFDSASSITGLRWAHLGRGILDFDNILSFYLNIILFTPFNFCFTLEGVYAYFDIINIL
jgi:hypothetical protein